MENIELILATNTCSFERRVFASLAELYKSDICRGRLTQAGKPSKSLRSQIWQIFSPNYCRQTLNGWKLQKIKVDAQRVLEAIA